MEGVKAECLSENGVELHVGPVSREHLNKDLRPTPLRKALKQKLMHSNQKECALEIGPIYTACLIHYIYIYGIIWSSFNVF